MRAIGRVEPAEHFGEAAEDVVARVQQVVAEPLADLRQGEGRRLLQHLLEAPLVGRRGDLGDGEALVDMAPRGFQEGGLHRPRRRAGAVAEQGAAVGGADAGGRGKLRDRSAVGGERLGDAGALGVVLLDDVGETAAQGRGVHVHGSALPQ